MNNFDTVTLPKAVQSLLEMNNFEVSGPIKVHGAEVDLVAINKNDPFAAKMYLEVTIEYVDNDKYGKDVGKMALLDRKDPGCRRIIVSSKGFSLPVTERAKETGIQTLTYEELFKLFQKFGPYVDRWTGYSEESHEISSLIERYEHPSFVDIHGNDNAIPFLDTWKCDIKSNKWLVVVGEYGTGKTALTKVVHDKWLREYMANPSLPIPFRIELRDFTRQFDDRSLLHHFLDQNGLSSISIDFVYHLIRTGKVLLILDGYDEMAQYMHARERRSCLEALASLASMGARGMLTSRPNYFSEAEELQLLDVLYRSLERDSLPIGTDTKEALAREQQLDDLLTSQFLDRFERTLADLTESQTESLVRRALKDQPENIPIVLNILGRVLRTSDEGSATSLGGKPVIISYLLQVVENLEHHTGNEESVSEWFIYDLIITNLMSRDLKRSPDILPAKRRQFLQLLALWLSEKGNRVVDEDGLYELISQNFELELRRAGDQRKHELDRLFADLRSSSTLSRGSLGSRYGWRFSHNSLREFLCAEWIVIQIETQRFGAHEMPISDAMRLFARSLGSARLAHLLETMSANWGAQASRHSLGRALNLLWDGFLRLPNISLNSHQLLTEATGGSLILDGISLDNIHFSTLTSPQILGQVSCDDCFFSSIKFEETSLENSSFTRSTLEYVSFHNSDLKGAFFEAAFLIDCVFTGADVSGASFNGISPENISIVIDDGIYTGLAALGYLNFYGAITPYVPTKFVYFHHSKYSIMEKIVEKLSEQSVRQIRGLTQRGEARQDPVFARDFVAYLERNGFVSDVRDDQISPTAKGRDLFTRFLNSEDIPEELFTFLTSH